MKATKKFDYLYLFSLHVACVNFFTQMGHRHFLVLITKIGHGNSEIGHGMAVIYYNGFSVAIYCLLMIYQKKLTMSLVSLGAALIYILNLVCQILQWPLC